MVSDRSPLAPPAGGVLVIGEALIDIVRRPGQAPRYLPGGSPMNVAVGLGRLGWAPWLASWYGRDDFGRMIERHCADSGVSLLPGSAGAARTSTAEAVIDAAGRAQYGFDLDWRLAPIPPRWRPALVHTGSIGAERAPGGWDVLAYVESIRAEAIITFDPNCRPPVIGPADQVAAMVERYVAAADLVKVSDEDLAWLYPGDDDRDRLIDRAADWLGLGPAVVVVTLGGAGSVTVTKGAGTIVAPADTSHPLVDTVGAGDAFMAGLIDGLLGRSLGQVGEPPAGWPSRSVEAIRAGLGGDRPGLEAILAQAGRIAGVTVSRPGADPPWWNELAGDGRSVGLGPEAKAEP